MFNHLKSYGKILSAAFLLLQSTVFVSAQETTSPSLPEFNQSQEAPLKDIKQDEGDTHEGDNADIETIEAEQAGNNDTAEVEELPEISYDLEALPFPTRRMHQLILEATKSGDIEKLRAYIGVGDSMTMLSLGEQEGDPIEFLKKEAGDKEGHEILAILEEVLEAGYVHLDKGTDRELFVWPYFFAYPLDKLTAPQMVELFSIVTYGDYQDMKDFGGYIFYRVGITSTGRWTFFVAGD